MYYKKLVIKASTNIEYLFTTKLLECSNISVILFYFTCIVTIISNQFKYILQIEVIRILLLIISFIVCF